MSLRLLLAALSLASAPAVAVAQAPAQMTREIHINGRPATAHDLEILATYEQRWGAPVPSGAYWYDGTSGAVGRWGGPAAGFLSPGLALGGGKAPASASGGGAGHWTGVFINGRELHPIDVQGLTALIGMPVLPGQWWVDGQGNFGPIGMNAVGNLMALARTSPSSSYYTKDPNNHSSAFVGSGCAAVSGRLRASDESSTYDYYVGCE